MSSVTPWTQNYRDGSFRNAGFFVVSVEGEIGRRVAVHEFVNTDKATSEDLGSKAKQFSFEAITFGTDARDKLSTALEARGPGQLIHPLWGTFRVVIISASIRESTQEGRLARFVIKATEVAGDVDVSAPNKADPVKHSSDGVFAGAGAAFAKAFKPITSASQAVKTTLARTVGSATTEMRKIKSSIDSPLDTVDDVGLAITAFSTQAANLILTPVTLANAVRGLFASIFGAINRVSTAFETLAGDDDAQEPPAFGTTMQRAVTTISAFDSESANIAATTAQRTLERDMNQALVALIRAYALAAAAALVPEIPYSTADETDALSQAFRDAIDSLALLVDDDTWGALQDMRASVSDYLADASILLPLVSQYTPADTIPMLCIAYSLYGDARMEADILRRNRTLNPAQVPGGVPLQVITDA